MPERSELLQPRAVAEFDMKDFLESFMYEHLKNINFKRSGVSPDNVPDVIIDTNKDFWAHVLKEASVKLKWIELSNFRITDWFPRSPGVFYTSQAAWQRDSARFHVEQQDGVSFYRPEGKFHMINGGVGSIRFKPMIIGNKECQLCTATSDGLCHTGVPIAIPLDLLEEMDFDYMSSYRMVGKITYLPNFLEEHFYHIICVPQVYVVVEQIHKLSKNIGDVSITPMVFFQGKTERSWKDKTDFVTYVTCNASDVRELDDAAEWLDWYAKKYNGTICTNYDQQRPTFSGAAFSLQNVMGGKLSENSFNQLQINHAHIYCEKVLEIQAQEVSMTENIAVTIGNGNVFHGDAVIGGKIRDIYTKIDKQKSNTELQLALKELTSAVSAMAEKMPRDQADQVVNDLQTLSIEATSPNPRKRWWELSANGLVEAAQAVGNVGKQVIENVPKVLSILDKVS